MARSSASLTITRAAAAWRSRCARDSSPDLNDMNRFPIWLLLLVLFGSFAGVAAFVLWQRAEAGHEMPPYSVYSEASDGLAETARLLAQLNLEPVTLHRPIQQFRPST